MNRYTSSSPKRLKMSYPRVSLQKVLDLAKTVLELGDGEPVRRIRVFDALGQSPDSRRSRDLVTAGNSGYGLTQGGYQAEFLNLTSLGQRILLAPDEISRLQATFDALWRNTLFADIVTHFNQKSIRTDEVAIDYLRKQHQLTQTEAETTWPILRLNLYENGLVQELAGKEIVVSRQQAIEHLQSLLQGRAPEIPEPSIKKITEPPSLSLSRDESLPKPQSLPFTLQIHITADTRPETLDHLFKNLTRYFGADTNKG